MDPQTNLTKDESAVFDEADLYHRLGNDQELIAAVVDIFIDDTPNLIEELSKAVESRNPESATRISHSIKGAAANVGGTKLSAHAYELEKLGRDGLLEQIAQRIPEIKTEYLKLEEKLKQVLQ